MQTYMCTYSTRTHVHVQLLYMYILLSALTHTHIMNMYIYTCTYATGQLTCICYIHSNIALLCHRLAYTGGLCWSVCARVSYAGGGEGVVRASVSPVGAVRSNSPLSEERGANSGTMSSWREGVEV